ncbi:bifunctional 23S rRNA (guanine(2069)-N(7))-methyltransferase RlmK/23S rRNA (guanine(2445)-N(2))-methyltransferase RlmL [Endothiovibrio diazotrophicus]
MPLFDLFATAPKGVASVTADELRALGATEVVESAAGVAFRGDLACAYRACLWSRTASRVLLTLTRFEAADEDALYTAVHAFPWEEHLDLGATFAVHATLSRSPITHSRFAALRVKDGIVDRFRERSGERPSVDAEAPDLGVRLHLQRTAATLSIDLSGDSLHRRGYRGEGVAAPLKENLGAAILLRSGWAEIAAAGGALVDPMCGSGTLLIEGAWIAADVAPGILRERFGFHGWKGHDEALWRELKAEAERRRAAGAERLPTIVGFDRERQAVHAALGNIELAGLPGRIHVERADALEARPPARASGGLLAVNPPYGERIGDLDRLRELYAGLGKLLKERFLGWQAAVFTGNAGLGMELGLRARRSHTLYNGALECKLLRFAVEPRWFVIPNINGLPKAVVKAVEERAPLGEGAAALANRLRKNLKQLGKWARREGVACYRLYDADMPEYAVAVDLYHEAEGGPLPWVVVQEYAPPPSIDAEKAQGRLVEALSAVAAVLEIPVERLFLKRRERQRGKSQYERQGEAERFFEVYDGPARVYVNFSDYLDSGLFLDHRVTRAMIGEMAKGKRFLNLFAYTGVATVHAVLGGAVASVTVDMSATYLDWADHNLELNGILGEEHELIQADCVGWLEEQPPGGFDLIFLDPPTFSTSKRMEGTLDVQRDHVALIRSAVRLLEPGGTLVFSNNLRKFRLDREGLAGLAVEEITAQTIPQDFRRNPRIHHCWLIRRG